MKHFIYFLLILKLLQTQPVVFAKEVNVSCKNEQGEDIDWFYLYKLPKFYAGNTVENDNSGLRYLYLTSNNYDSWQLSTKHISASDSIPAITLDPLFADNSLITIGYNDEFPNGTTVSTGGHTKGVIVADGRTGIWLIHSVPKFPAIPGYAYPASGTHYGQSFLCLTLGNEQMQKVGEQLIFNEPNIYYARLPRVLSGRYPNLELAIEGKWRNKSPYNNAVELETLAGKEFKSFAKSGKFQQDLYEDFVASSLDSNLLVESWRNGAGNMVSNCSKSEKVYNIAHIKDKQIELDFKTTNDHSKWAVSQATGLKLWRWRIGGSDWICVGDINRQEHQKLRGGGTICQKNSKVTEIYRKMVSSFDSCPSAETS